MASPSLDSLAITVDGKAASDTSISTDVELEAGDYLLYGRDGWEGATLIVQNGTFKAKGSSVGQHVTLTKGRYTLQIMYGRGLSYNVTVTPRLIRL